MPNFNDISSIFDFIANTPVQGNYSMPFRLSLNSTSSAMATYQYCICKCSHLLPYLGITIAILSFLIPHAAPLDFSFQQFLNKESTLNFEGDVSYDNGLLQLTQLKKDSVGHTTNHCIFGSRTQENS